jgi:hypothetical protein
VLEFHVVELGGQQPRADVYATDIMIDGPLQGGEKSVVFSDVVGGNPDRAVQLFEDFATAVQAELRASVANTSRRSATPSCSGRPILVTRSVSACGSRATR